MFISYSIVYISLYRIKYTYLVSLFTIVSILLYLIPITRSFKSSSLVIKSIITKLYSCSITNSSYSNLYSLYYTILTLL
jgi:hypothetical protein